MAHAFKGTVFRQRLDNVLGLLARRATRREVASLPASTEQAIRDNAALLELCSVGLDEEQRGLILQMLNSSWTQTLGNGEALQHECPPGCCGSQRIFHKKMRQVLNALFSNLFPCPLLYRWKNFDEACAWVARGMLIQGLLRVVWALCKQESADNEFMELQALDEDNPDMNPSLRQQVRVAKVMSMLAEPDSAARFLKTLLVSRPLTTYMDKVGFLETCRARFRLRMRGLKLPLPHSQCQHSGLNEIVALALDIIQGRAGRGVIADFGRMLAAPPNDVLWHTHLGLRKADCVDLLLIGAADGFRRLVLPYMCQPWQLFSTVNQSVDAALASFQALRAQNAACEKCQDPMFAKAPWSVAFFTGVWGLFSCKLSVLICLCETMWNLRILFVLTRKT